MMRKQLTKVMDKIINSDNTVIEAVEPSIINEYEDLNHKCDDVIIRIKTRKQKSSKNEDK